MKDRVLGVSSSASFSGMYIGTLPCADCGGILTYITFNTNGTISKTTSYQDNDGTSETEYGIFILKDKIVTVTIGKDQSEFYLIKSDSVIALVDEGKKEETSQLAANYRLTKRIPVKAKSLEGEYVTIRK
ncbi:copper resistance protein NlpE N-terminal domain-containing protein [Flavobacterium plurextorum]